MKIAVAANLLQLSLQPPSPHSQAVALPPPRCDTVTIIKPLADLIIGNLLGLAPYIAIVAAVALALAAVIVAVSRRARQSVLQSLGAQIILAFVLVALLGGIGILISSPCGT